VHAHRHVIHMLIIPVSTVAPMPTAHISVPRPTSIPTMPSAPIPIERLGYERPSATNEIANRSEQCVLQNKMLLMQEARSAQEIYQAIPESDKKLAQQVINTVVIDWEKEVQKHSSEAMRVASQNI
jgi:hypothetical protein